MRWSKKMPDVLLRRHWVSIPDDEYFVHSFVRGGRRWCEWRGHLLLLEDGGEVRGASGTNMTWGAI